MTDPIYKSDYNTIECNTENLELFFFDFAELKNEVVCKIHTTKFVLKNKTIPTMLKHLLSAHEEDYNRLILKKAHSSHFTTQFNSDEQCITTCHLCDPSITIYSLKDIQTHFKTTHEANFTSRGLIYFTLMKINIEYFFCFQRVNFIL